MALNIVTLFKSSGIFPGIGRLYAACQRRCTRISRKQFEGIFGSKEAYYGSECDMCTQWTRKDVDNRPELFLCCGKDDRLVYDAVEKLENALQKENITHEYRSGHGDHEFSTGNR